MTRRPTALLSLCLGLLCGAASASCTKTVTPPLSAEEFDAEGRAAYEKALESFHDRDWAIVPTQMAEVKRKYAGTRWARLAQLRIADAQFRQRSFQEAVTSYREFLREFPNDPEVVYARYKVAECQFEARGDSALTAPLEERDLVNVRDADSSITEFLRDYPNYKKRERLLYMQTWVRGMLARHELYVARYYLGQSRLKAAVSRAEYALIHYQDTGLEAEALVLLGECYMKLHEEEQAAAAFQIVLDRYPESPFVVPAKRFIGELEAIQPGVMMQAAGSGSALPGAGDSAEAGSEVP